MAALRQLLRLNCRQISSGIGCAAARPGPAPPAALGFRTYTSSNSRPRWRYGEDDTRLAVWRFLLTDRIGRRIFMFPLDFSIALGWCYILHTVIFGQPKKNPAASAGKHGSS